jgi:hypothetical protein
MLRSIPLEIAGNCTRPIAGTGSIALGDVSES